MKPTMRASSALFAALATVGQVVQGHTWVEQLRNINSNGTYVGDYGYPRGYVDKASKAFNGDSMNFLLPEPKYAGRVFINGTDPLCHPAQRTQNQSDGFPRLKSPAGGFVAMRYDENGHVSLADPTGNEGKPDKGGTVFVYGTTQPRSDEVLVDVLEWTADGTGGDGRGVLLANNFFDDGRCYENSAKPIALDRKAEFPNYAVGQAATGPGSMPLYCETDVQLPKNVTTGKPYTLYWVWQWPTAPNVTAIPSGKDQYYTTCMDVDIVGDSTVKSNAINPKNAMGQQDAMNKAVSNWESRTASTTYAPDGEVGTWFKKQASPATSSAAGIPAAASRVASSSVIASAPAISAPAASSKKGGPAIPSLTALPGSQLPNNPQKGAASVGNDIVILTETVKVTVTVSPAEATAAVKRAEHVKRHRAHFRGMSR